MRKFIIKWRLMFFLGPPAVVAIFIATIVVLSVDHHPKVVPIKVLKAYTARVIHNPCLKEWAVTLSPGDLYFKRAPITMLRDTSHKVGSCCMAGGSYTAIVGWDTVVERGRDEMLIFQDSATAIRTYYSWKTKEDRVLFVEDSIQKCLNDWR